MDIVRNKDYELELHHRGDLGQCNRECETVRAICEDITSPIAEDIVEFIYVNDARLTQAMLSGLMCSDICAAHGQRPKVPKKLAKKYKIGEEEWVEMDAAEKQQRMAIFAHHSQGMKQNKMDL